MEISQELQIQDAVGVVQKALVEFGGTAEDKDAVLRACLALNVPAYRHQLSSDPKPF